MTRTRRSIEPGRFALALLLLAALAAAIAQSAAARGTLIDAQDAPAAPAFTHRDAGSWVGSEPLDWGKLRGQVVLLDFWTFACWNCYRSFPWLNAVQERYAAQGLRVIGVHTPELPQERVRANLLRKIEEYGLHHPIMVDDDYSFWNAMNNRYWPAFYLIDKRGRVRALFAGETHAGDAQARRIEQAVEALLAETG